MKSNYTSKNHSKYHLTVHLILCTKYRKPLMKKYGNTIKELVLESAKDKRFQILRLEDDENHLHMLIDFEPSCSISYIIKTIKAYTTLKLWDKYEDDLKKEYFKKRVFWSSGYFVCTVGDASRENLTYYIENQG
ncbi:MAG: Transposase IS200 like protein [Candidatus Izimaplasma bacterium HR2]|nr:MAG: Transposase IS200 like protein [Candidatus Izimaplasma bacterium HR2]